MTYSLAAMLDELVAAIEADPDDVENYRVYADALQHAGDPRGQLITMQLLLETLTDRSKREHLERRIVEYVDRHRAALLPRIADRVPTSTLLAFWRFGFLRTFNINWADDMTALLDDLLGHPSGRFVTELQLLFPSGGQPAVDMVARRAPATLRNLELRVSAVDLSPLWPRLTRLRRLLVMGTGLELGTVALPALEELHVLSAERAAVRALLAPPYPRLRRVDLQSQDLSALELAPLLARTQRLERLHVSGVALDRRERATLRKLADDVSLR